MRDQSAEFLALVPAEPATKALLPNVDLHVLPHVGGGVDALLAVGATVLVDALVLVHVILQASIALQEPLAQRALELAPIRHRVMVPLDRKLKVTENTDCQSCNKSL